MDELLRHPRALGFAVTNFYRGKHEQPATDFTHAAIIDRHPRPANPLHHASHRRSVPDGSAACESADFRALAAWLSTIP
jgi:hypothetical protein